MGNPHTGEDPSDRRHWHLDKSVSVGHLLTTITLAGAVFLWAMKMETRISLLEQSAVRQVEVDQRQDKEADSRSISMRDDLRSINAKLDRIIERGLKP